MLEWIEIIIGGISEAVWPVFLPCMLAAGVFLAVRTFLGIQPRTTARSRISAAHIIGPSVISLGAMIGTGAIIGVLGSLSNLAGKGQTHIEALAIWALIGSVIMVPVSYSEVLCSKVMKKSPREYISDCLSPALSTVYAVCFCALHIFGFGGFQFSGIDSVVTIITGNYLQVSLTQTQRFLFIVIPLLMVVGAIVLTRKHQLFIHAMTYMITLAVGGYCIFFILFFIRTRSHIPLYIQGMLEGLANPVNAMLGVPTGLILGMQRVLQSSETGLGTLAMSAAETDSEPREAAQISLMPTVITIVVSIVVTSYITSYGLAQGLIRFPAESIERLQGYFAAAEAVTGLFGLIVLCLFALLSGLSVLLSSYYFLKVLFDNRETVNILIYLATITTAGTLAVFGFNIVFDVVDLLLFAVCGINMASLTVFAWNRWKKYIIFKKEEAV